MNIDGGAYHWYYWSYMQEAEIIDDSSSSVIYGVEWAEVIGIDHLERDNIRTHCLRIDKYAQIQHGQLKNEYEF